MVGQVTLATDNLKLSSSEKIHLFKVPKFIMKRLRGGALAFCITKKSVIYMIALFCLTELFFTALFIIQRNLIFFAFLVGSLALFGSVTALFSIFAYYPVIAIRKDCAECHFSFHIIAHELNHLSLNSLDKVRVEEATLEQTKKRLIPLLLSSPKMCKDCFFKWREMYSKATSDVLSKSTT